MNSYDFSLASILLATADNSMRQDLKSALWYIGFRHFYHAETLNDARESLEKDEPDLWIAEDKLPGGALCAYVHSVRHYLTPVNPFLPIALITRTAAPEVVRRIIDSGADDLLTYPFAPGSLDVRLGRWVQERKPFVVTSDYVGPDRRRAPRPGAQTPLIPVPNPLRAKLIDRTPPDEFRKTVSDMAKAINSTKIDRLAEFVVRMFAELLPLYKTGELTTDIERQVDRLHYACDDLSRRLPLTPQSEGLSVAEKALAVADRLREDPYHPNAEDLAQMLPIATGMVRRFSIPSELLRELFPEGLESDPGLEDTAGAAADIAPDTAGGATDATVRRHAASAGS